MHRYLLLLIPLGSLVIIGINRAYEATDLKFATAAESKAVYQKSVIPVLTKYCFSCHNRNKTEGELDLTALDPDMKTSTSGARWAMVVEKVTRGEMPPQGMPRPSQAEQLALVQWAKAEARRAGRPFVRRSAHVNGNVVPHHILFDPNDIPPFDAPPRIRRLSPEIYAAFVNDLAKGKPGIGQPFTPEGYFTFKDMGAPKLDEPVTAQLIQNAVAIVEVQTAYKIEDGQVKAVGNTPKEFLALFVPNKKPTDAQIEAAIVRQFEIILRRSPTTEEKQRFIALMRKNVAEAGQVLGARYTLAAVLLLPEAIFRMEVGSGKPDAKGRIRLSPREIAFAISYTLTDRRPDAELLKAAATGELDTDEGVANQVRRLLNDPKVEKPRILRFFREYFGYDKAAEVFKDNPKDFGYDPNVLISDTDALVLYILRQDKEVLKELLTTNKGFVNVRLDPKNPERVTEYHGKNNRKTHLNYNLPPDWQWTPDQPISFPEGQRVGILTQPSWLVAHSTSSENHVIRRGKWVRERLLGGVVPDVPITVDAQLPDAPHLTLRERMAVTQQEYCWKCHRLMNDLGYPFEQYDHYGRFRTTETVLDPVATEKNKNPKGKPLGFVFREVPVNIAGLIAHVGIEELEGPVYSLTEYMQRLARSQYVEQVFVRHAFRYFLGRNETPGDAATLQAAHKAYRENNGSMRALIVSLLSSESFLYRVPVNRDAQR